MDRKDFIRTCGLACVSGTVLAAMLESCGSVNYFAQSTSENNRVTVKKTEFIKTEKDNLVRRKYVLVRTETIKFPICIYQLSEEQYSALLMECTHRSCELTPQGNYLSCPCHGSEFSNTGAVQNPPAEKDLKTFKTTTDHDNIYIQL